MEDKKPSMINDLVKGALTTAISVLVTYYVTSAIKKDQYQQTDSEKEKQRIESLEKTSKLLSDYISRYDNLHERYISLLEKGRNSSAKFSSTDPEDENTNSEQFNRVSTFIVSGNWITPDGVVGWKFDGDRVVVGGIGSYMGFIEGTGNYQTSGSTISGTIHLSKAYYLPVNETVSFNLTLSSDSRMLYGSNKDAVGNVNAMTLYKN